MTPLSESHHPTGTAFELLAATKNTGGPVTNQARKGLPDGAHSGRSGSNSYGDCRHCPRSFQLRSDGTVPPHHPETEEQAARSRGPFQRCTGSGEFPVVYEEPHHREA